MRPYQLRAELKRRGLDQSGAPDELRERLRLVTAPGADAEPARAVATVAPDAGAETSRLEVAPHPRAESSARNAAKKTPPPGFFYQRTEPGKEVPSPQRVTVAEAQDLIVTGRLDESCLVWASGMGKEWVPLGEVLSSAPFSALQLRVRRPLAQMVSDCNERWRETLPETGTLSFAEDRHGLQWTSSAEARPGEAAVHEQPLVENNVEDLLEKLYAAGDASSAGSPQAPGAEAVAVAETSQRRNDTSRPLVPTEASQSDRRESENEAAAGEGD
eukprot:COSAG05_NODE_7319_length_828_cov_1.028807_1_plen_272_part_10